MNFLKHLRRSWRSHFLLQVTTLSVLTGTCLLISLALLLRSQFMTLVAGWGDEVRLNIYVKEGSTNVDTHQLYRRLQALPETKKVELIDKEQALKNFQEALSDYIPRSALETELGNPLPTSFEVVLPGQWTNSQAATRLTQLAELIRSWPGVDDVAFGHLWAQQYSALIHSFSLMGWGMLIVLLIGSVLILSNAIRQSVHQRRQELGILELFGATKNMVRRPYVFEGLMLGSIAGILSVFISYGIFQFQVSVLRDHAEFLDLQNQMRFWTPIEASGVISGAALVGAFGAWLSVRSIASGWSAAQQEGADS